MADSATVFNVQSAELELNKICENAILGYQNIFDGHIDQHSILFIFYLRPYCQFSLLNILCLIGKPQYIIQNLFSASVLEKSSSGHQESKFSIEYDYSANILDAGVANSL